jgi:hypothetical protein
MEPIRICKECLEKAFSSPCWDEEIVDSKRTFCHFCDCYRKCYSVENGTKLVPKVVTWECVGKHLTSCSCSVITVGDQVVEIRVSPSNKISFGVKQMDISDAFGSTAVYAKCMNCALGFLFNFLKKQGAFR